jgi:hypothetical protein
MATPSPTATPAPTATSVASPLLHIRGTSLVLSDSQRFVVKGVNFEFYRDSGCSQITGAEYPLRQDISDKLKSIGINLVRINYNHTWLEQDGQNLSKLLDMIQVFAQNGIYSMLSDNKFPDRDRSTDYVSAYNSFTNIIIGVRQRDLEPYVLMNPYNESFYVGPDTIVANENTLKFFRLTLKYKGVIALETDKWYGSIFQQVLDYDASLLKGSANVVYSEHWYSATQDWNLIHQYIDNSNNFPFLIGEMGSYLRGHPPQTTQFVLDLLDAVRHTGIPRGHNGVVAWIWNWCNINATMTNSDFITLNDYGNLYVDNYYSKALATVPTPGHTRSP